MAMERDFVLPAGLIGRFAIVKLWPEIQTAEDECIARLKIAAENLGLDCFEIHADGRFIENPTKVIKRTDVDFVLHLHYDTPKLYDAFSFVALWNPIQFYHEWGFSRTSRNLLTHDDFVSCSSVPADDHVNRLIRGVKTHLPPFFNLYHSVADIVHPPSLGDHKLFYAGINWDALRGGISRHQQLLQLLDKTGSLRIFGPHVFQGVKVWKGYDSYVREIPFDGVSMVTEISKSGIALVLSSQAHKDSELMSNRLFESIAAGALIICDENEFAKRYFGDSLLYIDSRCDVEVVFDHIESHISWARANPDKALSMIGKAQEIFKDKFSLNNNLSDLYNGLSRRKFDLLESQKLNCSGEFFVKLFLLLPEYSEAVLDSHIASAVAQTYQYFSPVLVVDKAVMESHRNSVETALAKSAVNIEVLEIDFFKYGADRRVKARRNSGAIIDDVLRSKFQADAVVFSAPNEKLFSNHLGVLVGGLLRNPASGCAATAMVLKRGAQPIHDVYERIDFRLYDPAYPQGYARFIFRVSALAADLTMILPYIDRKPIAALIGNSTVVQELPSTVLVDVTMEFPSDRRDEGLENELLGSYCPAVFEVCTGHEIIFPPALSSSIVCQTLKLFSLRWVRAQVWALRKHGVRARIDAAKRKLKLLSV